MDLSCVYMLNPGWIYVDLKYIAYWTQCIRITAKYEISYPVM